MCLEVRQRLGTLLRDCEVEVHSWGLLRLFFDCCAPVFALRCILIRIPLSARADYSALRTESFLSFLCYLLPMKAIPLARLFIRLWPSYYSFVMSKQKR